MRFLAVATALLLVAGCSAPAPVDETATSDEGADGPRTGRGDTSGFEENETEAPYHEVTFLSEDIQFIGVEPIEYQATVPEGAYYVTFYLTGDPTTETSELSVELRGCGVFRNGGIVGSTGGGVAGVVCSGAAQPGAQTATVAAQVSVTVGRFTLTARVPDVLPAAGNATAEP